MEIRLRKAGLLVVVAFQTERPDRTAPSTGRSSRRRLEPTALQGGMLCTRHNIVADGVTNDAEYRELDLSLNMWDNPQATTDLSSYRCDPVDRHPFGTPVAVTPVVGTGQTCLTELVLDWVLEMQIDNVNISLQAALTKPKPPAGQRRDELMPAAQVIAAAGVSR